MTSTTRRTLLQTAGLAIAAEAALALGLAATPEHAPRRERTKRPKNVIVAGAGLAGLCCAYELMMRGHEVVVFEASDRTGGHVRTIHDSFSDGLYADVGAEHFLEHAYQLYWSYVREFNLTAIRTLEWDHMVRFIDGKMLSAADFGSRTLMTQLGFSQRELDFGVAQGSGPSSIKFLYLNPYLDRFQDEYHPLAAGLDSLDEISFTDFLKREGASAAVIERFGDDASALSVIWHYAILHKRGVSETFRAFRIKGGNQLLPDTFARRLGERIHLNAPVVRIERGETGVRVRYRTAAGETTADADYLVCCMNAALLRQIAVTPDWPEAKAYVIRGIQYDTYSRVVFQSRSAFWKKDKISPSWRGADPYLSQLWPMAEEVNTPRAILVGTALSGATADDSLRAFRRIYPGKAEDIERAVIQTWATERWSWGCERQWFRPGEMNRMWPAIMEPVGRVHFAGAYTDNLNWGMEAATRSANRTALAIDKA